MSVEMLTFTSGVVFWERYNARQVPLDLDFQANTLLCAPSIPGLRTSLYCLTGVSKRFKGKSQCCKRYHKSGSPSHLGNAARLMLGDILLKMQGGCVLSVQEDDRDGKVPVSAFTRRDGHWPG